MNAPTPLTPLLQTARMKQFPKGQIILYEGDSFTDVFIIKSGIVKIYDIDEQGNEKILHLVSDPVLIPFAFFSGENAMTQWFYGALTDCEVYVIERSQLRQTLSSDHTLALSLMANFSQDVHELLVRLSSLGKTNTRDKLAIALRFLMVCHSKPRLSGWWRINFAVNHQLLADMIGVTRESVATVMKDLQTSKIIRNPKLTILEIHKDRLFKDIESH